MITRNAYSQVSFEVSDSEKLEAKKALIAFKFAIKKIETASNYLNNLKTPFKDNAGVSPEDVWKSRAALRRFRDKAVDNFNEFKIMAFRCVDFSKEFSSDTEIVKMVKSFISNVDILESSVNDFVALFDDLKSAEFPTKIVTLIEKIKKDCDEIIDLITNRIKKYIQDNIIASSWLDQVGKEKSLTIRKKVPALLK